MSTFDRLPPRARDRAIALQNAADTARAATNELSAQLRELRHNRQEVAGHIRNVTDPRFSGGRGVLGETEITGELQRLAALDAEIARIAALVEAQSAAAASAGSLSGRVEAFLRGLRDCAITDCSVAPPSLRKGEDVRAAIEARRQRVRGLIDERRAVEAAPIPAALAKKLAREQVERLAERGRIDVGPLVSSGDPFRFAQMVALVKMPPTGAGSVEVVDTEATLAWLYRDQLIAALDGEIGHLADDKNALGVEQRAARLEQLAVALLAAEREEVALVDCAAEQQITVKHRSDIDVRALLGVETQLVAEAA